MESVNQLSIYLLLNMINLHFLNFQELQILKTKIRFYSVVKIKGD